MTTYEPGTVAVATVSGVPNVRVMAGYGTAEPRLRWVTTDARLVDAENEGWWFSFQVADIRPLVVLDPKDFIAENLVPLLRATAEKGTEGLFARRSAVAFVADQIEAQLRPPKPAEPLGLGAVVEDAEGDIWSRRADAAWVSLVHDAIAPDYDAIDAVRVLSEGVSA